MKKQFKLILGYLLGISLVIQGGTIRFYPKAQSSERKHSNIQTLQQVHVVFRHGNRNPIQNAFPTDPYGNESFWPGGWGQLTEVGEESQFELGRFIRLRYAGFLNDKFDCFVQSSDVDRTIASAQANLAGLFTPESTKKHWSEKYKLNWQPVPVHTIDASLDNKINFAANCPKYQLLLQTLLESPFVSQINMENEDLYKYLTEHTGRTVLDFPIVAEIYDNLFVEKSVGLKLPEWFTGIYEEKMKRLAILPFEILTFNAKMTRLRVGPLLQEILDHMEFVINGTDPKHPSMKNYRNSKMFLYSGHDTTVSAILSALKLYDKSHIPPYCSIVLIELHKSPENKFFVKILYRNSTDRTMTMDIPGCGIRESGKCYYDAFKKIVGIHSITNEDWKRECSQGKLNQIEEEVLIEYHPYQTYHDMTNEFRGLATFLAKSLKQIFNPPFVLN